MSQELPSKFIRFSRIISLLSLIAILYDFFISGEFNIESAALIGISSLLVINLIRHLNKTKTWISFLTNGTIIIVASFIFFVLILHLFGYGYSGSRIHPLWFISVVLNTMLFFSALYEMVFYSKQINKK